MRIEDFRDVTGLRHTFLKDGKRVLIDGVTLVPEEPTKPVGPEADVAEEEDALPSNVVPLFRRAQSPMAPPPGPRAA
jgi:hypothetical protein